MAKKNSSRIYCVRTLRGCEPVDEEGREKFKRWKLGEILGCEIVKPRDGVQHKRYMGLLRLTYENIEHPKWPTFEHFRKSMQIHAGHFDLIAGMDGVEYKVPRSVSYDDLDEMEFAPVYRGVLLACSELLGGMDLDVLAEEVARAM